MTSETLNRLSQLINNARQDNKTPHHFRINADFEQRLEADLDKYVPSVAAQTTSKYRGVPVCVDDTVAGAALVVEEEALRVEA